ncbi:MAG: formate dehydrogenase accessory sulfurtransferase FdhD [Acidobacteriaceae bacterium]|nr:formate dehydrogenase accessory sulfurtransferase FdhD [Acidobacteriaceae bacterium]
MPKSTEFASSSLTRRFDMTRVENGFVERVADTVAAEEPLEIRIAYRFKETQRTTNLALTMRTPGDDRELAAGFLLTEGIIQERRHIEELHSVGAPPSNEMLVKLAPDVDVEAWRIARNNFVNASCGVCGKLTRDAIATQLPKYPDSRLKVESRFIETLPELLAAHQRAFAQTGGLHAAAVVQAGGEVLAVFEDIGRHNALDKVIGYSLLEDRVPLTDSVVFLSSRSSFELIQKAALAGAPVVATVGGPSSLAIEAARDFGITLLGFVRRGRFNVYSGAWRIHS